MRIIGMYYANTMYAFINRHSNMLGLLILTKLCTKQKDCFVPQIHIYLYFLIIIIIIIIVHN